MLFISKAHRALPPLPGMPMFLLRMVGQQNAHRHPTNQTTSQRSNCAGKHPPWKEVEALGMKDLEAVSAFLGDKVRMNRVLEGEKFVNYRSDLMGLYVT